MVVARLRAVVFDMGNTLWFEARHPDETRIYGIAGERLAPLIRSWGVLLPDSLADLQRDIWEAALEGYRHADERGTCEEPRLPFLIRGALAVRGVEISGEQAGAWWRTMCVPVRELGWQLYPDTIDVLAELKSLGLKVGICTTRPFTWDMFMPDLEDYGLAAYVDAVVCSADTGYIKPHRSMFDLVLRKLEVDAPNAVMVGDLCEADMAGGRAAGMRTVWKLNGRYEAPLCDHADYAIHDLAELLTLPFIERRPRRLVSTESLTPHEDGNADRY